MKDKITEPSPFGDGSDKIIDKTDIGGYMPVDSKLIHDYLSSNKLQYNYSFYMYKIFNGSVWLDITNELCEDYTNYLIEDLADINRIRFLYFRFIIHNITYSIYWNIDKRMWVLTEIVIGGKNNVSYYNTEELLNILDNVL